MPERGAAIELDAALLEQMAALPNTVREAIEKQAFHDALEAIWVTIRAGNAYIDQQAPWTLRKTDTCRMEAVLANLMDLLRVVATLLQPFMPTSMSQMLDQLGVALDARAIESLAVPVASGTALPPPAGVFPRFVEETA